MFKFIDETKSSEQTPTEGSDQVGYEDEGSEEGSEVGAEEESEVGAEEESEVGAEEGRSEVESNEDLLEGRSEMEVSSGDVLSITPKDSSSSEPLATKEKVVFDLTGMSEVIVVNANSICSQLCNEFKGLSVKPHALSFSKFTDTDTGKKMKMIVKFVEDIDEV